VGVLYLPFFNALGAHGDLAAFDAPDSSVAGAPNVNRPLMCKAASGCSNTDCYIYNIFKNGIKVKFL
jgi:hypothetical protein